MPLIAGDEVIGTFNVESPRPNAFTLHDLQFTETFSRMIAQALHTLELLRRKTEHGHGVGGRCEPGSGFAGRRHSGRRDGAAGAEFGP